MRAETARKFFFVSFLCGLLVAVKSFAVKCLTQYVSLWRKSCAHVCFTPQATSFLTGDQNSFVCLVDRPLGKKEVFARRHLTLFLLQLLVSCCSLQCPLEKASGNVGLCCIRIARKYGGGSVLHQNCVSCKYDAVAHIMCTLLLQAPAVPCQAFWAHHESGHVLDLLAFSVNTFSP